MGFHIGIDLASAHIGLAVLTDKGDLDHMSRKSTSPAGKLSKWDRYASVVNHAMVEVLKRRGDITNIVIEGYGGSHKNSLIPGVECGTVLRMALITAGLLNKVIEVPPTSLKKFVTGSGNAGKEIVIAYIYKNYGIMIPDNDQADAYGLAQLGRKVSWDEGRRKTLFAYEKEALKALKL